MPYKLVKKNLAKIFFFQHDNLFNNKAGSGVSFCSWGWPCSIWPAPTSSPWIAHRVWCGCAGFLGLCQHTCIPFGLSMGQRTRWCHSPWESPGQLVKDEHLASSFEDVAGMAAHTQCTHQFEHLPPHTSLVIVPTTTTVLSFWPGSFLFWFIQERDRSSWSVWLTNNLFNTTWLKVQLVHLARNLYSLTNCLR